MDTILVLLMILLVPLGLFLVGIILIQESKSGGLSGAFGGGGGGDSLLGAGASKGLSKVTAYGAIIFMVLLIVIGILCKAKQSGQGGRTDVKAGPGSGMRAPIEPGKEKEQEAEEAKGDAKAAAPKEDVKEPEKTDPGLTAPKEDVKEPEKGPEETPPPETKGDEAPKKTPEPAGT